MGEVKGLEEVVRNLNKAIDSLDRQTRKGLWKAGLYIKQKSQQEVPVDQGTLLNSAFIHPKTVAMVRDSITVGYHAVYAPFVHENPRAGKTGGLSPAGSPYKTWAQKGKWKFLEDPLKQNTRQILKIIKEAARKA